MILVIRAPKLGYQCILQLCCLVERSVLANTQKGVQHRIAIKFCAAITSASHAGEFLFISDAEHLDPEKVAYRHSSLHAGRCLSYSGSCALWRSVGPQVSTRKLRQQAHQLSRLIDMTKNFRQIKIEQSKGGGRTQNIRTEGLK